VHGFNSAYGESSFETICHLTQDEYDVPCLRHIVTQTFTNAMMHNDACAIICIEQYIKIDMQNDVSRVANWQAYIVHLALPYEKGNIESVFFVYDWMAYIWDIEICIWSVKTTSFLTIFHTNKNPAKIFNVIQFQTNIGNFQV
jgi:hypothetical protein